MKKITLYLLAMCLSLTALPLHSTAALTSTSPVTSETPITKERAAVLINRLNEINDMDKSNLSTSEKKQLRKEVKSIEKELNKNGGIYLSVAAIIIIVLLLILLV